MSGAKVGDTLAGKYKLEELLGSGGMGHVFRAVNEDVGRQVAIKVLRAEHATNAPIVERFMREARAANLVRHPNVVDVLDIGRHSDGSPFIVQELLRGVDLAKFVESRGGKLTLVELDQILLPIIDAVAEAHTQGVVHRDIKPENVFLAEHGHGGKKIPKLLDFGISKIRLPDIRMTEVGVMMGTPAYMSPEQIQGARDADPRADVWALGVMLFEVLAGRLPFEATDAPQLFVKIATTQAPQLIEVAPEVVESVSKVVERCLRRSPDERYPTAAELARDVRHVLDEEDIEPTQTHAMPPSFRPANLPKPTDLVIPDLALPDARPPDSKATRQGPGPASAPKLALELELTNMTVPHTSAPPNALTKTELVHHAGPAPAALPGSEPKIRLPEVPALGVPLRAPAPSSGRLPPSSGAPLDGVMLSGASSVRSPHQAHRAAHALNVDTRRAPTTDMGPIVAIAVIGLATMGVTGVLMSTPARQPEGFKLLAAAGLQLGSLALIVQGGLGLIGLILAGRSAYAGVQKWRGDLEGGRGGALFSAAIAGAFFFAAIELVRGAL